MFNIDNDWEDEVPQSSIRKLYKHEKEFQRGDILRLQSVQSLEMKREIKEERYYMSEEDEDEDEEQMEVKLIRRQHVRSDTYL